MLITSRGGSHARTPAPAVLPRLVQTFANPAIGASGQLPADWSALKGPGFLQLRARDGNALIVVASSSKSTTAGKLVAAELAKIRKTYTGVTIKNGIGARLGGLPAQSQVAYGTNAHRVPIRILVAGASGTRLNYILNAFTAQRAPVHDLVETQQIVLVLRLAG